MKNLKYLRVEGNHMYSICYYPINYSLASFTGNKCTEIFEKYNIPINYQKVFIKSNPHIKDILKRQFIGYEFFTNIPINIFKNDYAIHGEMTSDYPSFKFINAYTCDENEIRDFTTSLKRDDLLIQYINCIGEIFKINIKNQEKRKNLVRSKL